MVLSIDSFRFVMLSGAGAYVWIGREKDNGIDMEEWRWGRNNPGAFKLILRNKIALVNLFYN